MTHKSLGISKLIEPFRGRDLDAHYLAYFECFNRGLFFEAHDVLEELWLEQKGGSNYAFHKGLIQLAGAFVHLQKGRPRPASSLIWLENVKQAVDLLSESFHFFQFAPPRLF
jgi:predicted metal-dependent hydrolase